MSTARTPRTTVLLASTLALGLGLTACSSGGSDAGETTASGDQKSISIGIPSGWDEGIAVSHLWQAVLEEEGYDVSTDIGEAGVVFTGLAGGDFDVMFDTWLPQTHAKYVEKYGDQIADLGTWYDDAKLTIAVNEDSPARTIADLASMGADYDNRLVGIEAGAGLTEATQNEVIPTYGLEDMDYVLSSTPAMLSELKSKTEAGENVAVTLWRPHWAYDAFPVKDLEDPDGAMGEAEKIHTVARTGFTEDHPDVSSWISALTLSDEQLFSLENIMFNENDGTDNDASVREWLEANPTFVDDLKAAAQA